MRTEMTSMRVELAALRAGAPSERSSAAEWWQTAHHYLGGWGTLRSGELALFLLLAGWQAGGAYLLAAAVAAVAVDPPTALGAVLAVICYKICRGLEKSRVGRFLRSLCGRNASSSEGASPADSLGHAAVAATDEEAAAAYDPVRGVLSWAWSSIFG